MAAELASWPRPHFAPGGGNPLLFYVVFGTFDLSLPFSLSKYRASGLPEWLEIVSYERSNQSDVFADYQSGPMWEMFQRDAPAQAREIELAPQCIALRGEPADPPTLDYFRDVIGIATWLLDAGGCVIYDPQMLSSWPADEWREEVFEPNKPQPDRHAIILVSPEDGGTSWYHTRGMREVWPARLEREGGGRAHAEGVTLMLERFIGLQAPGGLIPDGEVIRMKTLPAGGVCRHAGNPSDPDFNNVHVEISWPPGALA